MDSDNENEGFQHQVQHTFDFVELADSPTITHNQLNIQGVKVQISQLQPPISTYVQMKNCPTPACLNNVYSYEKQQTTDNKTEETVQKAKAKPCNAWCCDQQKYINQQFNEEDYRLIYSKFTQNRSNYRYFRQYARNEYKMFVDQDTVDQYEVPSITAHKSSKLDFKKIQKIMSGYYDIQQLVFRSNFEGGNLERVYTKQKNSNFQQNFGMLRKTSSTLNSSLVASTNSKNQDSKTYIQRQYYLVLSNDTNTIGFNQWFYFKVFNPNYKQEIKATFIIVNVNKKTIENIDTIGVHSFNLLKYQFEKQGWSRLFDGVCVNSHNNLLKDPLNYYHTLQFQAIIQPRNTVYFALTIPYTYSKLQNFIDKHSQKFQILGTTFCGNPLHIYKTGSSKANKSILITSRQHPSQTSSSFVVEGIINKLAQSSLPINLLKKKYQIFVIPMVNPDGVIHGNSRTNLLGFDVNRKWENPPNKRHSYEVFNLINGLLKGIPKIQYLIDLHGHSKKLNSFAYYSTKKSIASSISLQMAQKLPFFSISDCQMATSAPVNTLRWYSATQVAVEKAITIETSIHGWRDQNKNIKCFTPESLQLIGSTLMEVISKIELQKKTNALKSINIINFASCHESSDSDPEGDYIKQVNIQQMKIQSPRKDKQKKEQPGPHKLRIKTHSTHFYKSSMNSTRRQRIKTQYNVDKVNIQLLNNPQRRVSHNKKTLENKIYRYKEKVTSIRKIAIGYKDIHESFSIQQVQKQRKQEGPTHLMSTNISMLNTMGRLIKKKLRQTEQDRAIYMQKIGQSSLRLSSELQSRYRQKLSKKKPN